MPALNESGFGLEPIARVQQLLNIDKMAVTNGYGTSQLASGFMVLLRQSLDGIAEINLKLPLQINIGVLGGTCADH